MLNQIENEQFDWSGIKFGNVVFSQQKVDSSQQKMDSFQVPLFQPVNDMNDEIAEQEIFPEEVLLNDQNQQKEEISLPETNPESNEKQESAEVFNPMKKYFKISNTPGKLNGNSAP